MEMNNIISKGKKNLFLHPWSPIIVLFTFLVALSILAPHTAVANTDGDYTYTIEGSPTVATITGYTGAGGAITIPSTICGYTVVAIGNSAFRSITALTSVTIPNSVTSIGGWAFLDCTSLTSVTIGTGVTSIGSFGEWAFVNCFALKSIDVDACNPYYASIDGVLYNKTLTTLIQYPSGRTGAFSIPCGVTSIGINAFDSCTGLTSIDVDSGNANYASIDGVLYNKTLTTLIQYPSGRTGAFNVPSSVTSIGGWAFYSCVYLTSLTIGSGVTSIGDGAFCDCTSLTSVTIPSGVTNIAAYTFDSCTSLTCVAIPDSITSIGDNAFSDCSSLTSLMFLGLVAPTNVFLDYRPSTAHTPTWLSGTPTELRGHAYAASDFPGPGEVWNGLVMGDVIPLLLDDYTYSVNGNGATITGYTGAGGEIMIPSTLGGYTVVAIGDDAFESITSLTSVTIPDNVTSIGSGAFHDCTSLTSVTIPDSVTTIGFYAFGICTSLTSVTIPNSVTTIVGWTFESCTSLTSVTIPNSVTTIGDWTFESCTSLTSVTIPNSVTSIGDYAFYFCTSLTSVTIGDGVASIGIYAFASCTSLTSVTIPNATIWLGAFASCTSLTSVTIGSGVTTIGLFFCPGPGGICIQ